LTVSKPTDCCSLESNIQFELLYCEAWLLVHGVTNLIVFWHNL